jgi:hypothetical protein
MAINDAKPFTVTFSHDQPRSPGTSRKDRKRRSATERAFAALSRVGQWKKLTLHDAAAIEDVSVTYVAELHRRTPAEQQDVKTGRVKLSDIINKRQSQQAVANKVDQLISRVGIDAVFSALDRATAPNGNGHSND